MARWLAAALGSVLCGALCATARSAHAGACCGDAAGLGDRLAEAESSSGTFGVTVTPRFGSFDAEGAFHAVPSSTTDVRIEPIARALVRVVENLELGAGFSGVVNVRGADEQSVVGGGVGDLASVAHVLSPFDLSCSSNAR